MSTYRVLIEMEISFNAEIGGFFEETQYVDGIRVSQDISAASSDDAEFEAISMLEDGDNNCDVEDTTVISVTEL